MATIVLSPHTLAKDRSDIKAEVTSSNTVGYQKITLQPGLNMIGGIFQNIATGTALDLNAQFSDAAENANYGADVDTSDQIIAWDASSQGYDKIYFYVCEDDTDPDPVYDYKWYDGDDPSEPTDASISEAKGAWYKNYGNTAITLTMCGQVQENATYSVAIRSGLNFVANPYPAPIVLNSVKFAVEGIVYGADVDTSDQIIAWDPTSQGYNKIYYYVCEDDTDPDPVYDYKWYDGDDPSEPTTFSLPVGKGFWFKHLGSDATLTFTKPY